jgi:phosphoribosylformylglycinamidine synthase
VGEVTENNRHQIDYRGQRVDDVDPRTVAHDGPIYDRPHTRPDGITTVQNDVADDLPRPGTDELAQTLITLLACPNLADKSWVTEQYDRFVRGNTALSMPEDAGMVRINEETGLGVAISTDCNARFAYLDPFRGAQLSLVESFVNVATTGATPLAITDCLNFGSPEDSEVMWQFVESLDGLVDGCRQLKLPVTGGNVSFYNKTGHMAILPTPVVGVLGVIDNIDQRVRSRFATPGDMIFQIGQTRDELSGSVWAEIIHDHLGGTPPVIDFAAVRRLAAFLEQAAQVRLLASAHDLSDGGLAVALAEALFSASEGTGIDIALPAGDPFVSLFSESSGRVIVSVKPERVAELVGMAQHYDLPITTLGEVTDTGHYAVQGCFQVPVADLKRAWQATIPEAMAA